MLARTQICQVSRRACYETVQRTFLSIVKHMLRMKESKLDADHCFLDLYQKKDLLYVSLVSEREDVDGGGVS